MGMLSADAAERWLDKASAPQKSSDDAAKAFNASVAKQSAPPPPPPPAPVAADGTLEHQGAAPAGTEPAPEPPPGKALIDHTVAPADTIWDLGVFYGSNVDEIVSVNPQFRPGSGDSQYDWDHEITLTEGRDADAIRPGEILRIPVPAPPPGPTAAEPPPLATGPLVPDVAPPGVPPAPPPAAAPAIPAPALPPQPAQAAACEPYAPFSPYEDPLANNMMWLKQGTFATRVLARLAPFVPAGSKLDSASKIIGLGGFGLANGVQKGVEAVNYFQDGDWGRGVASTAEGLNGLRIAATGIEPAVKNPVGKAWINKYLGGKAGGAAGIGLNVVAGVGRAVGVETQYDRAMDCATTDRQKDIAQYDRVDGHLGNVLDTANDIVPYVGDNPVNWATWLGGKAMDHWAASALEGSGYKPRSIGADHSRAVMPLIAAAGGAPTVEKYDLATAQSDDQRIVMDESNSAHKAAGIGAGAAHVTVTGVEVGAAAYFGRSKEAVYGVLQADHMLRQGANIWTDHAWQRPQERAAAVEAAGLDPELDPHRVEYEQEDFLHRSATSFSVDVNIARLKGKVAAGGATADEKRYLEIVEQFEKADISHETNGRGSNDGVLSPRAAWQVIQMRAPGLQNSEQIPDALGYSIGWVQGGGVGNTLDSAGRFAVDATERLVSVAGGVKHKAGDAAGGAFDFATSAPKKLFGLFGG